MPSHGVLSVALLACALMASGPRAAAGQARPGPGLLTVAATLGRARGAGNGFTDFTLGGGLVLRPVELRVRVGSLAFMGGCDAVVPTKCSGGSGLYYEAAFGVRFTDRRSGFGAWSIAVGPGMVSAGRRPFIAATVARDQPIGRHTAIRIEVFGRHLFDDSYRSTWGETHRQAGVRVGLGIW